MPNIDTASQWYPYQKVIDGYYDLHDAEKIPRIVCDYLIDAPQGSYTPPNNNEYSRCRFWKYLYYDEGQPLTKALPTIKQKMQVVFDSNNPENPPSKEKGYRLIPQMYVKQSQTTAQTRVYVYMGRTVPSNDEMKICVSICFSIWTNYTQEANTKTDAYSRVFAIEQALIEAFHGVNISGIGTCFFNRAKHPDCGSQVLYDGESNLGRQLTMAIEIATSVPCGLTETTNMHTFEDGIKLV